MARIFGYIGVAIGCLTFCCFMAYVFRNCCVEHYIEARAQITNPINNV